MQKEEFAYRIHSLLPGASGTAMEQFVSYAEELERDGTERSDTFYDRFYVELSLVKRDHGETVAEKLFNFGEQFTCSPFELRGTARLLAQGWPLEKIRAAIVEDGCDPTPEEAAESRSALSDFQREHSMIKPLAPLPEGTQSELHGYS